MLYFNIGKLNGNVPNSNCRMTDQWFCIISWLYWRKIWRFSRNMMGGTWIYVPRRWRLWFYHIWWVHIVGSVQPHQHSSPNYNSSSHHPYQYVATQLELPSKPTTPTTSSLLLAPHSSNHRHPSPINDTHRHHRILLHSLQHHHQSHLHLSHNSLAPRQWS